MMKSFLRKAQLVQATANATQEPLQVVGLTATASGQTTINLSWTADATPAPNGATSYEVERSVDGLGSWSAIGTVTVPTTTVSDTSLSANQQRWYRVSAYNSFGGGLPSASANATTAAGSLSPSWSLDFSSGTPSGYTLTRASSATRVDSSGYIASSSTDIARLTHNSSGSRLGLLVEGQRTNLLTYSEAPVTGSYGTFGATWTENDATSPSNTTTAAKLTEAGSASDPHYGRTGTIGVTNGASYSWTVYAKAGTSTVLQLSCTASGVSTNDWANFDLSNGVVGSVGTNVTGDDATITNVGNGWYRCKLTFAATATSSPQFVYAHTNNSTTAGRQPTYAPSSRTLFLWGWQLEENATASSYIPTTTATVTRSADLAHVLDSSITSWGDPGALVVHFYPPGQAGTLISTDDASTAQVGIEASTTTAARAFWSSGSTATGTIGTGVQKAVHYWTGSTSKFCINGGTVQSGTNNLTIGNTDFVTLGAEATESGGVPGTFSQYANCVIRKVEFYSGTLTDANLQTITT